MCVWIVWIRHDHGNYQSYVGTRIFSSVTEDTFSAKCIMWAATQDLDWILRRQGNISIDIFFTWGWGWWWWWWWWFWWLWLRLLLWDTLGLELRLALFSLWFKCEPQGDENETRRARFDCDNSFFRFSSRRKREMIKREKEGKEKKEKKKIN